MPTSYIVSEANLASVAYAMGTNLLQAHCLLQVPIGTMVKHPEEDKIGVVVNWRDAENILVDWNDSSTSLVNPMDFVSDHLTG